jgi:hypothetical protein
MRLGFGIAVLLLAGCSDGAPEVASEAAAAPATTFVATVTRDDVAEELYRVNQERIRSLQREYRNTPPVPRAERERLLDELSEGLPEFEAE